MDKQLNLQLTYLLSNEIVSSLPTYRSPSIKRSTLVNIYCWDTSINTCEYHIFYPINLFPASIRAFL